MIQTKQTVLLWLAAILPASLFKVGIASTAEQAETGIFADGVFTLGESTISLLIYVLAAIIAIATSLLYKNRALQVKTAWVSFIVFLIGMPVGIFMVMNGTSAQPQLAAIAILLISLLMIFLSIRFIKQDIAIVKSMDRLR
jgi:uncharacterized membrane protein YfcA